ncbi:F-box protein At5g49610-like [Hordeum vulgare subsp. vulgare]|uniref:F-box associated beta-propeller type 3 domain-containing protein n=1 Tax=Hordeum vulgare subsp. vulgare TaxID=112509 RepID=A0A8I6XT86_HORVV|nr:F-box protein At5g49610-like [Hordeum vulgare subsp. vulgare]
MASGVRSKKKSMPDSSGATVLDDLPEWLVVEEILVRLPTKDVLRCRAVKQSWRAATSTDKFVLNHHRHQPSLPIFQHLRGIYCLAAAGEQKIRHVVRYSMRCYPLSCDGLLILSRHGPGFYICNPATRKWAPLPPPSLRRHASFATVAFYRHRASAEHRVLWSTHSRSLTSDATVERPGYLVLPVGSHKPRCVQWPTHLGNFPATRSFVDPPVHHRGGLHWALGLGITVFDTDTETFRQMSRPAQLPGGTVSLIDTCGDLALCRAAADFVTLDVWMLQDYDAEAWSFRYRIDLRAMEASPPLDLTVNYFAPMMAVVNERELLIQHCSDRLLHCDIDGVFLGDVEIGEHGSLSSRFANSLTLARYHLKESMISLPLFEMQREDAVNEDPPFTIVL